MEQGRRNSPKFAQHVAKLNSLAKGRPHTESAKRRMSVAIKASLLVPPIRARISAAGKGRKVSGMTRKRMRVCALSGVEPAQA
jgi:hypothetical protein